MERQVQRLEPSGPLPLTCEGAGPVSDEGNWDGDWIAWEQKEGIRLLLPLCVCVSAMEGIPWVDVVWIRPGARVRGTGVDQVPILKQIPKTNTLIRHSIYPFSLWKGGTRERWNDYA
jgi:hypothetical protein